MAKALKKLIKADPEFLSAGLKKPQRQTRHFQFTYIGEGAPISMPICGSVAAAVVKHKINGVDCPDCLAALDALAGCDDYEQALAHAQTIAPKVMKPDPDIMNERHGKEPTRRARLHTLAATFMQQKGISDPAELPLRMIGDNERTLFKNLYETGLLNEDGEPSGLSAEDLATGKTPETDEDIFER